MLIYHVGIHIDLSDLDVAIVDPTSFDVLSSLFCVLYGVVLCLHCFFIPLCSFIIVVRCSFYQT